MPDHSITSNQFTSIATPGACKMQVHDAAVFVTFTAPGTTTRGLRFEPGDVIPIGATDAPRIRKADADTALVVFEVFG